LDYYIAETYDDALAATTYIKNIKLGRATFIVLEQLKGYPELERAMKNKFTAP
jgi:chromosome segregation ATPase